MRIYIGLGNLPESIHFGAYNMGMVAAATIDLMVVGPLANDDLAAVRSAAQLGQRAGRISNVLATYERELAEGDLTNEMMIAERMGFGQQQYRERLEVEHNDIISRIRLLADRTSIDLEKYATGISDLHQLHFEMIKYL